MHPQLQELQRQWAQNQRLRLGVMLIVLIVVGYGLLLLSDYASARVGELQRQQQLLAKLQAVSGQNHWLERAMLARAQRTKLENRLWRAETRGLAQAELQGWLARQLARLELRQMQVDVGQAEAALGVDGVWRVTAQIKGVLTRQRMVQLLDAIENHEKLTSVFQNKMAEVKQGVMMSLHLQAYFLAAEPQGAGQ